MSPRRLALIPLVPTLAFALVLGACSSGGSSSSSGTASGSAATTGGATSGSGAAPSTDAAPGTLPPVPQGFKEIDRSADGFVVALPPGWQSFDLTSADVDAIVSAATAANPNLSGDVAGAVKKLVEQGGLLYASDTSNPGKFLTNVNLIKVAGVSGGLGLLQQQAQSQLTGAGASNVSSSQVKLPGGDAVRTTYTVPVTLSDGTKSEVAGLQVYFLKGNTLYVLTFSTDQPDKYSQTFDQIIATFSPV